MPYALPQQGHDVSSRDADRNVIIQLYVQVLTGVCFCTYVYLCVCLKIFDEMFLYLVKDIALKQKPNVCPKMQQLY